MDSLRELKYLKEDIKNYLNFMEDQILKLDMCDDKKDGEQFRFHLRLAKTFLDKKDKNVFPR